MPATSVVGLALVGATMTNSCPDDIRAKGWMVAVHNDYRLNGVFHTFWLFTKGSVCAQGEGLNDAEALDIVRQKIQSHWVCVARFTCDNKVAAIAETYEDLFKKIKGVEQTVYVDGESREEHPCLIPTPESK